MKLYFAILMGSLLVSPLAFAEQFENRCGWVQNPTPANWWLIDKDATWVIGVQGGHQAEGEIPAFPENSKYWTKTNGNYGYGCACLQVKVDKKTQTVLAIKSGHPQPLAKCRADKNLKSPKL
jgi:hypothetical protein